MQVYHGPDLSFSSARPKAAAIFDKDDVLAPFVEEFAAYLNEKQPGFFKPGAEVKLEDFKTYDFTQALLDAGVIQEEFIGKKKELTALVQEFNYRFIQERMAEIALYPGARDFVKQFAEGRPVVIVTACQQRFHEQTLQQLEPLRGLIHTVVSIGNDFSDDPIRPIATDLDGKPTALTARIEAVTRAHHLVTGREFRPTKGHISQACNGDRMIDDGIKSLQKGGEGRDGFVGIYVRHPWNAGSPMPRAQIHEVRPPSKEHGFKETLEDLAPHLKRDSKEVTDSGDRLPG